MHARTQKRVHLHRNAYTDACTHRNAAILALSTCQMGVTKCQAWKERAPHPNDVRAHAELMKRASSTAAPRRELLHHMLCARVADLAQAGRGSRQRTELNRCAYKRRESKPPGRGGKKSR
eukprot:827149-Pleurochrysis_carterae.AAC.1